MLPAERRKQILEIVEAQSSVSVTALCERLDVSEMTIRRDLRLLSDEGLLKRVHGGAVSRRARSYEPPYLIRASANIDQKRAIACEVARLIEEGDSIAIDVGTTTQELASVLAGKSNITAVTSSLPIANLLSDSTDLRLILTGGVVRKQELSMTGHLARRAFEDFWVDKALVGIGGVDIDAGLTEYNLEDALVKQAMIEHAGQIIVLADSSKIYRTCFAWVAALSAMHTFVTDWQAPPEFVDELRQRGIEVIVARQNTPEPVSP